MIDESQVYRPSEVAKVMRVSALTITRTISGGKLRAFRVGGQWRILGSDLMSYLNRERESAMNKRPD
jgi:excisionase family DNA binding protein